MSARTQAHRRPVLSGRHQLHALLGERHRRVRRLHPGPPHHHRGDPGRDGPDPGGNSDRRVCPGVDPGKPGGPAGLQCPAPHRSRTPHRGRGQKAPGHDALAAEEVGRG